MEGKSMANILIRNVPDEVLNMIKNVAKRRNRSLQQELREALETMANQSSPDIFRKATELKEKLRKKSVRFTDSAELLREDRAR
jgi:plasmid stability protein